MKVVFLDRDGVINEYPGDLEYVKSWEEFRFLPGAIHALKELNRKGYRLFVISNQAGVGRGIYPQEALDLITKNMLEELKKDGIEIAGVYYCTHRKEEDCSCRKPKTGMIELVHQELKKNGLKIDFKESYFIGDTIRDVETGKSAGLKTVLIFSGKEKPENKESWQLEPDCTARDLAEAVERCIQ